MKKMLKIIGIILFIPIVLIIGLLVLLSFIPAVPKNYTKEVKTGGEIEAKYLSKGKYKVKSTKSKATELTKYNYVYYPEELENCNKKYPVVVVLNGTGILPKKYRALFEHLASWGFIVVGNDDGSTGFGKSADETIKYIKKANEDTDSVFYEKIDIENLDMEKKKILIKELLKMLSASSMNANLKEFGLTDREGRVHKSNIADGK